MSAVKKRVFTILNITFVTVFVLSSIFLTCIAFDVPIFGNEFLLIKEGDGYTFSIVSEDAAIQKGDLLLVRSDADRYSLATVTQCDGNKISYTAQNQNTTVTLPRDSLTAGKIVFQSTFLGGLLHTLSIGGNTGLSYIILATIFWIFAITLLLLLLYYLKRRPAKAEPAEVVAAELPASDSDDSILEDEPFTADVAPLAETIPATVYPTLLDDCDKPDASKPLAEEADPESVAPLATDADDAEVQPAPSDSQQAASSEALSWSKEDTAAYSQELQQETVVLDSRELEEFRAFEEANTIRIDLFPNAPETLEAPHTISTKKETLTVEEALHSKSATASPTEDSSSLPLPQGAHVEATPSFPASAPEDKDALITNVLDDIERQFKENFNL